MPLRAFWFMERGQNININRNLEGVNASPLGWLGRFKTSVEEVTTSVVKIAKDLELEVKPEDGIELLQFHDETWMEEVKKLVQVQIADKRQRQNWEAGSLVPKKGRLKEPHNKASRPNVVSVAMTQLCHCSTNAAISNTYEWIWLYSIKL